jgi:hypothetical protein
MIRKRDGPAPPKTTPGPGANEHAQSSLPPPKSLRKSARTTTPKIRSRRRQGDPPWRGFAVRLYLRPGSDARALYALLRAAAQKYGLEVASVDEIRESGEES